MDEVIEEERISLASKSVRVWGTRKSEMDSRRYLCKQKITQNNNVANQLDRVSTHLWINI